MNPKERYRTICEENSSLPVFLKVWWLDIVCGVDNWGVCLSLGKDDQYQGSLVYFIEKKRGLTQIKMPPMTSYSGLWMNYPQGIKLPSRYTFDKKVIQALLQQLPDYDLFYQQLHPQISNALPFHWAGFRQTYVYTYLLDLHHPEQLYHELKGSIRTDLKKAASKLKVETTEDLESFKILVAKSYQDKQQVLPYSFDLLDQIDHQLRVRQQRKIFLCKDESGNIHAGVYIILEEDSAYYYMGARDAEIDQFSALTLALWEAIQYCATQVKQFDFEGSIIEYIESFFRAFGGQLHPHLKITKTRSKWLHILSLLFNKEYH